MLRFYDTGCETGETNCEKEQCRDIAANLLTYEYF